MEVVKKYLRNNPLLRRSGVVFILPLLIVGLFMPVGFADAILGEVGKLIDVMLFMSIGLVTGVTPAIITLELLMAFSIIVFGFIPVVISALLLQLVAGDALIRLPYTHGGIVDIGWNVTRDIANLALIAILLVMAVRTILGNPEKGVKLLPKLIGIALIINFTKVIAGVVVDFANIITNYFLSAITDIGTLFVRLFWTFLQNLGIMKIVGLFINAEFSVGWLKDLALAIVGIFTFSNLVNDIVATIAAVAIGIILSITQLVFAAVFFMRYIAIWLLVIFSPLAFAAMILPDTAKFAKEWWSSFTKWAFIGVGPAFILFITARIIQDVGVRGGFGKTANTDLKLTGEWYNQILSPLYNIVDNLLFIIVIVILMWMGLSMSLKMNDKAGKLVTKYGGKAIKGATAWAKDAVMKRVGPGLQQVGERLTGSKFAGGKLTGGAFRTIGKGVSEIGRAEERAWDKEEQAAKKRSKGMNAAILRSTSDPREYNAAFKALGEEHPDELAKIMEEPDGRARAKAENMVRVMSRTRPGSEKGIIDKDFDLSRASSNVQLLTDGTDADLFRVIAEEEATGRTPEYMARLRENLRVLSYTRRASAKKVSSILPSSLAHPYVQLGLEGDKERHIEGNRNITFAEAANDPEKMKYVRKGLSTREHDHLLPHDYTASKQFAEFLLSREKTLEYIAKSDLDPIIDELAHSPNLTINFLNKISREHGEEYARRIYNRVTEHEKIALRARTRARRYAEDEKEERDGGAGPAAAGAPIPPRPPAAGPAGILDLYQKYSSSEPTSEQPLVMGRAEPLRAGTGKDEPKKELGFLAAAERARGKAQTPSAEPDKKPTTKQGEEQKPPAKEAVDETPVDGGVAPAVPPVGGEGPPVIGEKTTAETWKKVAWKRFLSSFYGKQDYEKLEKIVGPIPAPLRKLIDISMKIERPYLLLASPMLRALGGTKELRDALRELTRTLTQRRPGSPPVQPPSPQPPPSSSAPPPHVPPHMPTPPPSAEEPAQEAPREIDVARRTPSPPSQERVQQDIAASGERVRADDERRQQNASGGDDKLRKTLISNKKSEIRAKFLELDNIMKNKPPGWGETVAKLHRERKRLDDELKNLESE